MDLIKEITVNYDLLPYIKVIIGMFVISRFFNLVVFLAETNKDTPKALKNKPIITQYEPPEGLSPIDVGTIINRQVDGNDISAVIIDLVVRGYAEIGYLNGGNDLEFKMIKEGHDLINPADKEVFKLLFTSTTTMTLSALKSSNKPTHSAINTIIEQTEDSLCLKGYLYDYAKTRFKKSFEIPLGISAVVLFFVMFFSLFYILMTPEKLSDLYVYHNGYPIFIVSTILFISTSHIYRRMKNVLTKKGIEAYAHIRGFKIFLEKTQKDRLDFFNSPANKPATIERFLPYAMVLHIESKWSKTFEGLYMQSSDQNAHE